MIERNLTHEEMLEIAEKREEENRKETESDLNEDPKSVDEL